MALKGLQRMKGVRGTQAVELKLAHGTWHMLVFRCMLQARTSISLPVILQSHRYGTRVEYIFISALPPCGLKGMLSGTYSRAWSDAACQPEDLTSVLSSASGHVA